MAKRKQAADEVLGDAPDKDAEEPALAGMLIRDGLTLLAALAIWGGADAWAGISGLHLAVFASVGTGIAAGWIIASLLHEWGHYAGAKLSGAAAPRIAPTGFSFFRYRFDLKNNSLEQFTYMSIGGNLAHWGLFLALLMLLPLETAGQAAIAGAALAFALFASIIEWPIIARTQRGDVQPTEAFTHIDEAFIRRHYLIGGIGGLLFFAVA